MDLSALFPPSDLLEKVRGVESGLRQRKKIAGAGAVASIVSIAVSAFYLLAVAEEGIKGARDLVERTLHDPVLLLLALVFFLSLAVTWSRYWLRESRQPFRYTCSIGSFVSVEPANETTKQFEPWMRWMPHDMTGLLNERVQRFFFADEGGSSGSEPYIHVRAHWVVRKRAGSSDVDEIEIMPRIRLGPPDTPEVMAHSTVFELRGAVDRGTYEELLEQVYHSVVTEVYRQLKGDVETKVQLLPTKRHRAIALLFEAGDYAKSNTLHAYSEAAELYRSTAALCDPEWRQTPTTRVPRMLRSLRVLIHGIGIRARRFASWYRPSAGEIDLIGARAMSGYARMLVFTRVLRALAGQKAHTAFDAAPVARRAIKLIESLNRDIPSHAEALYDVHVTRALGEWNIGDPAKAAAALEAARALDPQRAEEDGTFILASGLISPDTRTRLSLFKRAVNCDPRSEVAQFCLANEGEMLWRLREPLERGVAELVIAEYDRVRTLNPGNLAAYATSGYVYWLLEQNDRAQLRFEQGRRFKISRKEPYIAELDYGLARIEAERGNFAAAYPHYLAAISSLPDGVEGDFRPYFFQTSTPTIERRLRSYYRTVRQHAGKIPPEDHEQVRIGKSMQAFALNDVGEAYLYAAGLNSYLYDRRRQRLGTRALEMAIAMNPAFLLPYGVLTRVTEPVKAMEIIRKGLAFEPSWTFGKAVLAERHATLIPNVPDLEEKLQDCREERKELTRDSLTLKELKRQKELEEEIVRREKELAEAKGDVIRHRTEALRLIRDLMPQEWLWKGPSLRLETLTDRTYENTFRWERELTVSQVVALGIWARCHAVDAERLPDAIRVYEHIRKHFWPAASAADVVMARLRRANASLVNTIIAEELDRFPAVAIDLALSSVKLTKAQLCEGDVRACQWNSDHRDSQAMKERRAAAYKTLAVLWKDTDDAEALYRESAKLSRNGAAYAKLAGHLETRAAAATGEAAAPFLERAVAAAADAVAREPKNQRYRQQLTALKWTRQFGSTAKTLLASPRPLAIEISPEIVDAAEALLARTEAVRRTVLGAKHPVVHVSDPLVAQRQYRILIKGRVVADEQVPQNAPLVDWILQRLETELHRNIDELLQVDDVTKILNAEQAGEGERIRELMPELSAVLRMLAAERIPLPPLMPIVRAFRQAYDPAATLTEVVEQVRVHPAVQKRIAALQADSDVTVVRIGPAFEKAVRAARMTDRKITDGLRKSVADSFGTNAATHRLLVCPPDLRPSIAKLVEGSVERLTVASEPQVAPRVLRGASRIAEYVDFTSEETP